MELYCAIDLRGGRAVRLEQGDFSKERRFGDPIEVAERYLDGGATHLHVVDLDAARSGVATNRAVIAAIVERSGVPVQVGGGVRDEDDVAELLGFGVDRVVMGTTAILRPDVARACAARHPQRLVLGLDYRRRSDGVLETAASGWEEGTGASLGQVLLGWQDEPLAAVVVTAIDRDGTAAGPDLEGLAQVLDGCEHPVVASGGVGSRRDLEMLAGLRSPGAGRGPSAVVVGTALLEGTLSVREAVSACAAFA